MSEDEFAISILSFLIAVAANAYWIWASRVGASLGRGRPLTLNLLAFTPLLAAGTLGLLLKAFADEFVRNSNKYLAMYCFMGLAWAPVAAWPSGWLGISIRDDVGERRNPAAGVIHFAVYMGLVLCFAGGNFGDGPAWGVVVFSALLATLGFYAVWLALELAIRLSEHVSVDRDFNAALRGAGVLLGSGLLLGRSVAGDWVSMGDTLDEFWPIATLPFILAGIEVALTFLLTKKPTTASRVFGILPAAGYVGLALILCAMQGVW